VDVNWINTDADAKTWSPVHAASAHGHPAVLSALLEHGADQHRTDLDNHNCMGLAAKGGHPECIRLLRDQSQDPGLTNYGIRVRC
jgi:ankyrin repeat protein